MTIQGQLPAQNVSQPLSGGQELLSLLAGKAVDAKVVATFPQGQADIAIGREVLRLTLPILLAAGDNITLQMRGTGENARLTILPPQVAPAPQPQPLPDVATIKPTFLGVPSATAAPPPVSTAAAPLPQQSATMPLPPGLAQALANGPVTANVIANPQPGQVTVALAGQPATLSLPQSIPPGTPLTLTTSVRNGEPQVTVTWPPVSATTPPQPPPLPPRLAAMPPVLAQAVQHSLPNQQSIAGLFATLALAEPALARLSRPVADAAQKLTRQQLQAEALTGTGLRDAIARSGVFMEGDIAATSRMQPLNGDIKAALIALRGALGQLAGAGLGPLASAQQPPPPQRGAIPRAHPDAGPAALDVGDPRALARALLEQTDGALSRVRLAQAASLPDGPERIDVAHHAARPSEFTVEIPMMVGREQTVAQFQVAQDGSSGNQAHDRAWHMRFAINLKVLGEVGAHVLLRGKRASVSIWAVEADTAEVLNDMSADLAAGFAAAGLEPGSVQVRQGVPRSAQSIAAGGYVERVT